MATSNRNGNMSKASSKPNNQTLTNNPFPSKECNNCGSHSPHFIHQVRLLAIQRRLCTNCVLRLHPTSFCPGCFAFYDGSPPHPSNRVSCSNCSSLIHAHCAGDTLLSSYLCPPCKDSSFSYFPLKDNKIEKKLALALLCAAKIASSSMVKAVAVAKAEAERRVRESTLAKKQAREAVEHLLLITLTDKAARKKEIENNNTNLEKVEDLDMENADADGGDGDVDGDIDDDDLVRHIEDSLVKADDISFNTN